MCNLIRWLYRSWHFEGEDLAAECETVAISFAEHVVPRSKSTYLFMLQHDFRVILKSVYPWGLGIFCQDICESWKCILKRFSNHHTHRGGGRGLTVKREGLVLLVCWNVHSSIAIRPSMRSPRKKKRKKRKTAQKTNKRMQKSFSSDF